MKKDVLVIRESIGRIVSMLTNQSIKVTQRGSRAYVKYHPKTGAILEMNIPYIPDDASDEFIAAVQGFLDHEVGHVLFSDSSVLLKSAKYGKRVMNLANIVEDVYVERKMTAAFQGSGVNLESVRKFYLEKIARPKIEAALAVGDTESARGYATVAAFRGWGGQTSAMDFIKEPKIAALVQQVSDKLGPDLLAQLLKVNSSEDCLSLARKLKDKLEEPKPEAPTPPTIGPDAKSSDTKSDEPEDDSGDDDSEEKGTATTKKDDSGKKREKKSKSDTEDGEEGEAGGGDGEDDHEKDETESGDDTKADSPEEDAESGEAELGDSDGGDSERSDSDDGESEDSAPGDGEETADHEPGDAGEVGTPTPPPEPTLDPLADMFDTERDFDKDMGDKLSEEAKKEIDAADYAIFSTEWDKVLPAPLSRLADSVAKMEASIMDKVGVMQKSLERAVAAQSRLAWNPAKRTGRIAPGALFKTSVGDDRVFRQRFETKARNTALSLVVDCSGSMSGERIKLAGITAFALSMVLERLKLNHEVIGFTTCDSGEMRTLMATDAASHGKSITRMGWGRIEPLYLPVFKPFGSKLDAPSKSRLAHLTESPNWLTQNVDGECIQLAARRLKQQRAERHIMIVLSDGDPACSCGQGQEEHLKKTVKELIKARVEVVGIGIQSKSVRHYYPKNVVLNDLNALPIEVMAQLTKLLLAA